MTRFDVVCLAVFLPTSLAVLSAYKFVPMLQEQPLLVLTAASVPTILANIPLAKSIVRAIKG